MWDLGKFDSTPLFIEKAFISTGFRNRKKATTKFSSHEKSKCHNEAMQRVYVVPKTTKDVGEWLSTMYAEHNINVKIDIFFSQYYQIYSFWLVKSLPLEVMVMRITLSFALTSIHIAWHSEYRYMHYGKQDIAKPCFIYSRKSFLFNYGWRIGW